MQRRNDDETPIPNERVVGEWTPVPGMLVEGPRPPRAAPRSALHREVLRHAVQELDSPLWAIRHLARWLRDDLIGQVDAVVANNLELLCESVDGMAGLLHEIDDYLQVDGLDDHSSLVDLYDLVRDVFRSVGAPESFQLVVAENLPAIVTSKDRLQRVLSVLLENAVVHHDRPDGRVSVSARHRDGRIELAIADDGPGVPAVDLDRIFRPFVTTAKAGSARRTGLGLTIARRLVALEDCGIRLEAHDGIRGTTVRFEWSDRTVDGRDTGLHGPTKGDGSDNH